MGKFLLLLAVILLIFWILKFYSRKIGKEEPPSRPTAAPEDMVRCVQCGVNLPRSESLISQGEFFCSEEHRRQHRG